METGIKGSCEFIAEEKHSAKTMLSGTLDVLATPALVAMLEKAAWESVQPYLEEGCTSVGTLMNITHDAATPLGMKVRCESELIKTEGRKLVFNVEAFDDKGRVGGGIHERFIIQEQKFLDKIDIQKK